MEEKKICETCANYKQPYGLCTFENLIYHDENDTCENWRTMHVHVDTFYRYDEDGDQG